MVLVEMTSPGYPDVVVIKPADNAVLWEIVVEDMVVVRLEVKDNDELVIKSVELKEMTVDGLELGLVGAVEPEDVKSRTLLLDVVPDEPEDVKSKILLLDVRESGEGLSEADREMDPLLEVVSEIAVVGELVALVACDEVLVKVAKVGIVDKLGIDDET